MVLPPCCRMKKQRKRKCRQCGCLYKPDPRSRYHQYTCSAPACQKARKQANQRRWAARPANADYFRGPAQAKRVRAWRDTNPGYWRKSKKPLQDDLDAQPVANEEDKCNLSVHALQDEILMQPALLVGLISTLTGNALQDDIAFHIRHFHHRGQQILQPKGKGSDDQKTSVIPGAPAQDPGSVQLGGP